MSNNISSFYRIGQRIQAKRRLKGYTQRDLARLSGIGLRTIQKYECNEVNPKVNTLKIIADNLDCDIESILSLSGISFNDTPDLRPSIKDLLIQISSIEKMCKQVKKNLKQLYSTTQRLIRA